jgi:hypothetical protein
MAQFNFSGGCVTCLSQETFGEKRCIACKYFECNWQLPDLSISEHELKALEKEFARRRIKDLPPVDTEETEACLQEIKKQDRERRRKGAQEIKRKIELRELAAEQERERIRILKIENKQIMEYEKRKSIVDRVFEFFHRLVSDR